MVLLHWGSVTSIWPRPLIGLDAKIDSMQREIETKAIETIARHQPLAVDLRELVSAFHIVNDLERIGDLAKSICKRALVMDSAPPSKLSVPVLNQLGLVLESYAERDATKALSVWLTRAGTLAYITDVDRDHRHCQDRPSIGSAGVDVGRRMPIAAR
jgi:phosphate transport system protein